MCDLRPGDRVVCIKSYYGREGLEFTISAVVSKGEVPRELVGKVGPNRHNAVQVEELEWMCFFDESDERWVWGYPAESFRPVAKRSDTLTIESFLTIKPGYEEPRRVVEPVRRKEGV